MDSPFFLAWIPPRMFRDETWRRSYLTHLRKVAGPEFRGRMRFAREREIKPQLGAIRVEVHR